MNKLSKKTTNWVSCFNERKNILKIINWVQKFGNIGRLRFFQKFPVVCSILLKELYYTPERLFSTEKKLCHKTKEFLIFIKSQFRPLNKGAEDPNLPRTPLISQILESKLGLMWSVLQFCCSLFYCLLFILLPFSVYCFTSFVILRY